MALAVPRSLPISGGTASKALTPQSPTSPGHIDAEGIARLPDGGYSARFVADKTAFTGDLGGGLGIEISGADLHDEWTWSGYAPGSLGVSGPDAGCVWQILAPEDTGNSSGLTALVAFCGPDSPQVFETFAAGCPCTPDFAPASFAVIRDQFSADRGEWSWFVDFTSGGGVTTLGVASDTMNLIYTPAVLVTHGWEDKCDNDATLEQLIRQELAVVPGQVDCAKYDSRKGVASGAVDFALEYIKFRSSFPADDPIQIVAHSMGGLVARYWYQFLYTPQDDGEIGSISMLGTPNTGVNVAKLQRVFCPTHAKIFGIPVGDKVCAFGDWVSDQIAKLPNTPDFDSQAVKDLKPKSNVLKELNTGFVLPASPIIRAHVGRTDQPQGLFTSGSFHNDCFISEGSVLGPGGVFDSVEAPAFRYPNLSHDILRVSTECTEPTLVDDVGLVDNMLPDLEGDTILQDAPAAAPAASASPEMQDISHALNGVNQGGENTEDLTVPAGLAEADFTLSWLYNTDTTDLSFTLVRPDGTTVAPTDPDVAAPLDIGGTGAFYVLSKGLEMNNPAAGTWHVIVGGTTVPDPPQPYMVSLGTDSAVSLDLDIASDPIQAGQAEVITASLDDNGTLVAPATISASVMVLDGTSQPVTLHDDGLGGDAPAGDFVYTGSIDTTGGCGTYRVAATASGSTSEGSVTREQLDSYDVSVPGDAVRDPCNPDDDQDGLTDDEEQNTTHTDALAADTDADGITDGAEVIRGTNPLLPDTIAAAHIVTVADFAFTDAASGTATTTVHTGDTVTWDWTAGTHSVCSGNNCSPVTSPANTADRGRPARSRRRCRSLTSSTHPVRTPTNAKCTRRR